MKSLRFLTQTAGLRIRRYLQAPEMRRLLVELRRQPIDPELHFSLGKTLLRAHDWPLAAAELRSAITLGKERDAAWSWLQQAETRLAPLARLEHNQYHRYDTLAREVSREHDASGVSVLDIGGGKGYLAQFLPQVDYCLAEPDVNGISGVDMPFEKGSFDYVVSCHVLEHVPPGERVQFLDRLCATARRSVILLNPFHVDGTCVTERLRLLLRVTGAAWAQEHLECGLPYLDDVEKFAQQRGISYRIRRCSLP